jgi:aromatic-L-amino-acid decarboxylase
MDWDAFRHWSRRAADWGADYRETLRDRPVRPDVKPGGTARLIADAPPEAPEPMEAIFSDFEASILPGMTHWQHPRFFAYFPANAAPAAVVAEYLASAMAAQCMLWQTSPAATELETKVTDWLRQALALPAEFQGVIQDTASSATLAAVLVMRERALGWDGNRSGLSGQGTIRVYCSDQVHSSIDRAIWVSGVGERNLVRITGTGPLRGMDPGALDAAIAADKAGGLRPAGIIASVGGTSTGGTDDVAALAEIAQRHGLYLHVDAAWAGSAMICPEFRHLWAGAERADSIVFNPHKWLGAPFECSVQFVRDPTSLRSTLAIRPEFLKTPGRDDIINYSEWSIDLGRRFRALKLWFLLRAYGLSGLRGMIRDHVAWAGGLADRLAAQPDFDIVTAPVLSLFTFRHRPKGVVDLDAHNLELLERINREGAIYITQTRIGDRIALRFQVGQFETTEQDVAVGYETILRHAHAMTPS